MNFDAFIKDIQQNNWQVYGVEVYKDGKLFASYGDTTEHRYPIYSATKTITSIAVGLAVDEGKMDVGKSILQYLPAEAVESMPEAQKEVYQQITVKRLLTMSIQGYPFRPEGDSWLTSSLGYPLTDVGRRVFDYSNVPAYLVGVAVSHAVGEDLYEYLSRKVFQPLDIHEPKVGRCPEGYFYGASSMELTVRELSKIGLLLASGGVYEGKRILSKEYVKEATSIQQMNREGGYGYFIWKYRDGFSINGKWGQKCYVVPSKGLMVTYLAHLEEGSGELRACMEKHLLDCE
ncbi:MAG: beta-lactamase family protein [Lachnospiraceae bacterium]|nr:beta-lactamase family protein [Lachnospiraceae bacterium]